jgi:hypothetical protein
MSARSTRHPHHLGGAGSAPRAVVQLIACTLGVITLAAVGSVAFVGTAAAATASPIAVIAPAAAAQIGLFGSQDPTYDGVYRQSLAIMGLVATGHTPNAPAVNWLLSQQCADGAFTAYRADTTKPCTASTEDENSTALAVQALVALGKPTTAAITALRRFQLADGGFYDNTAFGPAASDANSTGLAESALVAGGVAPLTVTSTTGKTADDYLRSIQIACSAASGAGAYDTQGEATLHANDYATVQALLGELGKTLPVATAAAAGSVPACPSAVTGATTSAAAGTSYLATRLTATGGQIPSSFGSGTDWTTTANAVLDLDAAGAGTASVAAAIAALEAHAKAYTQTAGAPVPGPLATLLLVAHANGIDPGSFGGVDLTTTLATAERIAPIAAPAPKPSPAPSPSNPTSVTLPMTGATDVRPIGSVAAVLVGLGLAALAVSRRRAGGRRG